MLRAIFGGSDNKKQAPVLTPDAFDAVFGAHAQPELENI